MIHQTRECLMHFTDIQYTKYVLPLCAGVPSLERTELEAACEGFINVIGTLPECTLYKGTLSSGVEIAVLSTSLNSAQQWSARSEEQFRNKVLIYCNDVKHTELLLLLSMENCRVL